MSLGIGSSFLHTLLELGNATSQNLGFAYADPITSYGEETITETNLLEMRRRHPKTVKVYSFSKQKESHITGADWEWHIIGRALTLKLRVQAKRITKTGAIIKLDGQASKAPLPQIDLLIRDATTHRMKPIYCFYSAEQHRTFLTAPATVDGYSSFETGCLIADAHEVRKMKSLPKYLKDIEKNTVPWHYLCLGGSFEFSTGVYELRFYEEAPIHRLMQEVRVDEISPMPGMPERPQSSRLPTIFDLNIPNRREFDTEGVEETRHEEFERQVSPEELEERRIARMVLIDVREPDFMLLKFER